MAPRPALANLYELWKACNSFNSWFRIVVDSVQKFGSFSVSLPCWNIRTINSWRWVAEYKNIIHESKLSKKFIHTFDRQERMDKFSEVDLQVDIWHANVIFIKLYLWWGSRWICFFLANTTPNNTIIQFIITLETFLERLTWQFTGVV